MENKTKTGTEQGKTGRSGSLPPQKPIGEESAPKKKSPFVQGLLVVLAAIAVAILLLIAYLLLLVGEPKEENKSAGETQQVSITSPMSPLDMIGGGGMAELPATFGDEVLVLNNASEPEKIRVNDTAYGGSYARTVTISYRLEDGSSVEFISLRPLSAAPMLTESGGFTLYGEKLYTLAGMNAARMDRDEERILFAQSDTALYAIRYQSAQSEAVEALLGSSALLKDSTAEESNK